MKTIFKLIVFPFKVIWQILFIPGKLVFWIPNIFSIVFFQRELKKSTVFKYCQYILNFLVIIFGLIASHEGLKEDAEWYPFYENKKEIATRISNIDQNKLKNKCDRYIENGCTIDMKTMNTIYLNNGVATTSGYMKVGNVHESITLFLKGSTLYTETNDFFNFPKFYGNKEHEYKIGPYKIEADDCGYLFSGNLYDLKNDTTVGWFNGNQFMVETGMNWKKSTNCIEIIDKYGLLCFSIFFNQNNIFEYRGYFKEDGLIYITSDDNQYVTDDFYKARKLLETIKPRLNFKQLKEK